MKSKFIVLFVAAASLCAVGVFAGTTNDIPRMFGEDLKDRMGEADLVVVDVRTGGSWNASDARIQGAVREDPKNVQAWMKKYPRDRTLVFYCS